MFERPFARLLRLTAASLAVLGAWASSAPPAQAANYRVRSITIGRATQYFRADRSVAAPRVFTQGLSLWGYDLLGDRSGSLDLHVSFRYNTDFSLERAQRDNPYFADQWNELSLDLAYLDWRPLDSLRVRFGRQWSHGALGVRDFDGLALRWRPRVEAGTHAHFEVYGGRDIQTAFGEFDAATFDVQGLPPDDGVEPDKLDGFHMLTGASVGMSWGWDANVSISWRRRFAVGVDSPVDGADHVVGSERFGAAASAAFHPRLAVSAHGSYHSQLAAVDRAGMQVTWRIPARAGTLGAGVDHRHPWFDSSSIFNLFGANPFQGAFATYQLPVAALDTTFQLRSWGRIYHAGEHATAPGVDALDERSVGGALGHDTRLRLAGRIVRWSSLLSYQASLERESGQLLADTRLRAPLLDDALFVSGRGLVLAAQTDHLRFGDGAAATGVLGVDVPVADLGTLSAAVETTVSDFYPTNTSVYGLFAVEHWP